jgi:hypothetical protein
MKLRLVSVCAVVLLSMAASAATLAPGSSVSPVPDLCGGTACLTFTVLQDTGKINFSLLDVFGNVKDTGDVVEHVDQGSDGFLYFIYGFEVTSGNVGRISVTDYTGFSTDVGTLKAYCLTPEYCPNTGNTAPVSAGRSADGSSVYFDFGPLGVTAGNMAYDLVIRTNAQNWQPGSIALQDGGNGTVVGFSPAVPEPASMALFGSGLLGIAGVLRRKRAR